MKQLTSWHYLALLSLPLGIYLSLQFGLLGLALFTVINLTLCHFCPDSFLFQKRPDAVHRFSKKQFYSGRDSGLFFSSLMILVPVVATIIVWVFSPQELSKTMLNWSDLGVVNDYLKMTLFYIVEPSAVAPHLTEQMLADLESMIRYHLRLSLYAAVCRLLLYIALPIAIVFSTFDRTRAARSSHAFGVPKKPSQLERLAIITVCLSLFFWLDFRCSTPYAVANQSRGTTLLAIMPTLQTSAFWFALLFLGQLFSRPQSCQYEHATDHELYLERRHVSEIKLLTVSR